MAGRVAAHLENGRTTLPRFHAGKVLAVSGLRMRSVIRPPLHGSCRRADALTAKLMRNRPTPDDSRPKPLKRKRALFLLPRVITTGTQPRETGRHMSREPARALALKLHAFAYCSPGSSVTARAASRQSERVRQQRVAHHCVLLLVHPRAETSRYWLLLLHCTCMR